MTGYLDTEYLDKNIYCVEENFTMKKSLYLFSLFRIIIIMTLKEHHPWSVKAYITAQNIEVSIGQK